KHKDSKYTRIILNNPLFTHIILIIMRKTFLGVLVFMSQLIFAQGIEVISTKALTLDGQGVFLPKISPKGDCVLVTNEDMSGLKKFDLATGKLTTITNDRSAGFNAQ